MDQAGNPVTLWARLDPPLSRWLWLVKWLLLIPHLIVLAALWLVFIVLTVVAFFAILFTERYPRALFDFNVGVLRWTWRVGSYGYQTLATDRYPPFTLADVPDYPARVDIAYPDRLNRWLPLVKWLLAIPHVALVSALTSGASWTVYRAGEGDRATTSVGLVAIAVLIVGCALLFANTYPRGLFALLVGVTRWAVRVGAYLALLTDRYPPFRLDQGGDEPGDEPDRVGPATP